MEAEKRSIYEQDFGFCGAGFCDRFDVFLLIGYKAGGFFGSNG
jgi:hypothetical protein